MISFQVFLPTDDYYVWLMAKLWYNNSDAAYHQSILHIGELFGLLFKIGREGGIPRSVVGNVLDRDMVVSDFEFQSGYYIHF